MDAIQNPWRNYFENWPSVLPRRGVIVTSFDEQIPFDNFLTKEDVILFERRVPDVVGARKVLLQYPQILAVKIVDPVKLTLFQEIGFFMPQVAAAAVDPVAPPARVPS